MFGSIKHIAFASPDARRTVGMLQEVFGEAEDAEVKDLVSAYRVGRFTVGDVQIQFCEPLEGDERFSNHLAEHGPGLHHICFTVDDIEEVIARAEARGIGLKPCLSCGVVGSHPHPEGWIAFFGTETVPELQIEVMQVYKSGEKEKYWGDREEI
jgi:methylmalonyl-CoA/ethylmalonyl-CoA epimerase